MAPPEMGDASHLSAASGVFSGVRDCSRPIPNARAPAPTAHARPTSCRLLAHVTPAPSPDLESHHHDVEVLYLRPHVYNSPAAFPNPRGLEQAPPAGAAEPGPAPPSDMPPARQARGRPLSPRQLRAVPSPRRGRKLPRSRSADAVSSARSPEYA